MSLPEKDAFTLSEIATYFATDEETVKNWAERGLIGCCFRIRSPIKINWHQVDDFSKAGSHPAFRGLLRVSQRALPEILDGKACIFSAAMEEPRKDGRPDVLIQFAGKNFTVGLPDLLISAAERDRFAASNTGSSQRSNLASSQGLGRREQQIQAILSAIDRLGFPVLAIPYGGKARVKEVCLQNRKLFTERGFDHAWSEASTSGRLAVENKEQYLPAP